MAVRIDDFRKGHHISDKLFPKLSPPVIDTHESDIVYELVRYVLVICDIYAICVIKKLLSIL